MGKGKFIFRVHAVRRMFERGIGTKEVRHVLRTGELVESYPDDLPYPSRLVLGWIESRPIHVVAAENEESGEAVIITVYEPDPTLWESDFRRRKKQ